MAATAPLVRLRRLALPLALVALFAAAAHGQTLTSAFLTGSTTITVTMSNSTGSSADCRNAFSYFDVNNGTKSSPFANCTASGTSTVLLTLASAGTYAAGDQLNVKVNQTTLNTTAGTPFVAAAAAVAVPPVIGAATLTASRTVVVKLPLSGNTVPDSFATNMTVCGGAVELRAAGASAAKVAPFESCNLAVDVLTLTLKSAGTYAPGDTVNVASGQSILKFGTTAYAPLAGGSVIRPTLTSVSLSSTTTILIGTSGPASLPGNATADVCNAVFNIALKNTTLLPGALSACSVGPGVTAITATLANGTSYSDGMTVTLKANQTALKAGDQTAASPLFVPPSAALAIAPTILSASLTAADTITVVLPVASTLDTAACNSAFELRAAASATAKSSPFSACSLTVNNTQVVLTLASASTYASGDILDIKSGNDKLLAGSTAYVPQSVTVLPTLSTATLVSSTVVRVALPVVSSIPAPYSADDCARSIIVAAASSTVAKGISGCALSADKKALLVTLAAAYQPGDTVNVRTGQWQLRAGASVTLGPNYIASAAAVAILPGLSSATLVSATQVVVTLPAASNVPATFSASDCNAAIDLVSAAGASKDGPFAACALGAGNATLILNLTATAYAIGDTVTVKSAQTTLKVGNTSYTPYSVSITPILLPTTTAVLVSETSISVTLPTGFTSYLPSSLNASDCNAAFVLVSAAGAAKTAPYTSCAVAGTALTLGLAAGTYAAGDSVNVKAGNRLFLGASSSGPAYAPSANGTQIKPTITYAALVGASTVWVSLSAPATLNSSSTTAPGATCNAAFAVTGKSDAFTNCTFSSDQKSITFVTAVTIADGDVINLKDAQTVLTAAGTGAADSPAFAKRPSDLTIRDGYLVSAHLTSVTTIVAKLSIPAGANDALACNSAFVLANSTGTAKSSPFSVCAIAANGLSVTLTLSASAWVAGDTLNIRAAQDALRISSAANGPGFPARATAYTVAPAITVARATSSSTIVVSLPLASDIGASPSCSNIVEVNGGAKTVTACSPLTGNGTVMTVTIGSAFASGDTINVKSGNNQLKVNSTSVNYEPFTAVTVSPTLGTAQVVSATKVLVSLPATTITDPSPLTATACSAAIDIMPSDSTAARSGIISTCSIASTTLTLNLASNYVAGDRINVKGSVFFTGVSSNNLSYVSLSTPATIKPTLASAKAVSATVINVTLPVGSLFVKSDGTTPTLFSKSDCDNALVVSNGVSSDLLASTNPCDINSTSSRNVLVTVTSYAPGNTINVGSSNTGLYAGSKTGPVYIARPITIDPAYVTKVVATAADTIVVTLPAASSSFWDTTTNPSTQYTSLTAAQCDGVLEIKGGSTKRALATTGACTITGGTTLTIKLNGTSTHVFTSGDTFNFLDANVLLKAGSSDSDLNYVAAPTPVTILSTISAAALTARDTTNSVDTISITLPTTSTFVVSNQQYTSLNNAQCAGAVVEFNNARALAAGNDVCQLDSTKTVLRIKLNGNIFQAGDTVTIKSGQNILKALAGSTAGESYVQDAAVNIGSSVLTSAVATAADTIVVTLPQTAALSTSASVAVCSSIVEVLAGGSTSSPRQLTGGCGVSGTGANTLLTVVLDTTVAGNTFSATDTIRIKSGNTVLRVNTGSGAAYTQATNVTAVAAGFATATVTAAKTVVVSLPVTSSLWTTVSGTPTNNSRLGQSDCNAITTLSSDAAATACVLAATSTGATLTVSLLSAYTAAQDFNFDSSPANAILRTGSASSGLPYVSMTAAPKLIPAYLDSVKATDTDTIVVNFPVATALASTADAPAALAACQAAIKVYAADGTQKAIAACALDSGSTKKVLTLDLAGGATVAAHDYVTIVSGQTYFGLDAASTIKYGAITMSVAPAFLTSAAAVASTKILVALPVDSYLASPNTCTNVVSIVNSVTEKNVGCQLSLDGTGRYLTITLSGTSGRVVAASDTVKISYTNQDLRVGNSTGALYAETASALSTSPATYVITATAIGAQTIEVALPVAAVMNDLTDCNSIFNVATKTVASCKLLPADKTKLRITLSQDYGVGDTLNFMPNQPAAGATSLLMAGSSTASAFGTSSGVVIRPAIATAVATSTTTFIVSLPVTSTLVKPTCSANTLTCTDSSTPTCGNAGTSVSCTAGTAYCSLGVASCSSTPSCQNGATPACSTGTLSCGGNVGSLAATCSSNGVVKCDSTFSCSGSGTYTYTCGSPPSNSATACTSSETLTCSGTAASCSNSAPLTCGSVTCGAYAVSCSLGGTATCTGGGATTCGSSGAASAACADSSVLYCRNSAATISCGNAGSTNQGQCQAVFATSSGTISACTAITASTTTTVTVTAITLGMTVDLASGQAAGTAAVTLRAGDGSGATYKARAVTIAPGIASATLTSARTISVALPFASSVPSSWGTTTDSCNAVFTIFQGTSSTMTRTAPIDSCVLEADKKTVTLTLKATNDFAIGDTIDIKDGQTLLSGDASTPVLYIPRPTAVTIAPTIVSAMLVTSTTARVQLPVISNTLGSTTCPQLTFLVLKSSAGSAKGTDSGVGACASVSSGILTYTYVGATFAAGDYLEVVNTDPAMSTPPLNGGGAGGPAYVARGSPVVIYDATTAAPFVSATAISSTKIEIMLPTVSALTGSTCPFLAFTPTKTVSSCSLDATGLILTVTLADSTPFVAGSLTVGIAASTTVTLTYGTTAYTSSLTAIQVKPAFASAALTSSSTVVVTLPAGSSLWAHATTDTPNSDGVLGDAACATVLSVNPAGSPTSGPVTLAASACKLVSGESTVLVTYNSAYTPGDTINILASNAGTGSPSGNPMRVGTVVGGEKYIARRAPILITPVIASASAIGLRTIQVVLPTASALFDSTETALTRALTSSECDNVLQVSKADGSKKSLNGTNACALTTTTLLTITLGEDFAPADTVNMKDSNTMLRVGTKSSGPRYGASSAAVKILISFFKSAIAPDTSTVVVKLPFSSKLYTTADATVTGTPTTVQCDSIVKVGPSTFSSQRALDGTTPCTLDDTTLTLKIDSGTYAAGDYVDVGPGTSTAVSAILRGDTALASVTATSRAYFQAASQTTKTTGALQINPTLTSAAATGRSEIKIMLPVTGFLPSITFNASDCLKIVKFTPTKTLATTSACAVSGTVLTVKLSGAADATGVFAGGDAVDISTDNSGTNALRALNAVSGPVFASYVAQTIVPNIVSATAWDSNVIAIGLSAVSYAGTAALDTSACDAILTFSGGAKTYSSAAGVSPCVLDAAKTTLIVTFDAGTPYADTDTVNVKDTNPTLKAGTTADGPLYKARTAANGGAITIVPAIASAKATGPRTIMVALPVASSFFSSNGGTGTSTDLNADQCAQVLQVTRADGTARALALAAACSLTPNTKSITINLASNETFAAGDLVNVVSSNAVSGSTGAGTPLRAGTTGSASTRYVPRASAVPISPGYLGGAPATGMAYAVGLNTIIVQLPVTSSIAADNTCSNVVTVQKISTPAASRTVSGACAVSYQDGMGYYLTVTAPYTPGDEILIKDGNTALVSGSVPATGTAYVATTALPIRANFDYAVLTAPTTVFVAMVAPTTVSLVTKADCDALFVFTSAGNSTKTTSPIASCSLASDSLSVTITLTSADAYAPGDALDIKKNQNAATVGSATDTPSTQTPLVPLPVPTTIMPLAFGARATLVAPTAVAFSLPAVSSLPATPAAADCNNAVRYTDVSGMDAVNPFTSCAITPDTKGIAVSTSSPIYKAGDVMNIKPSNSVLRWGPQATGAAYYPAAADVPVFATVATATLVDPSTVVLGLPTVSAIPANFTVPDCLRAIEFKTAAGVAKNGTVASCILTPDRLGLQVKLLSAGNFSAGDTVNVKPEQSELRSAALATGPSYVPKLAAQVVNPALFANANLTSATSITVRLPFASALAAGADCKTVLALLSAGGAAKNVSSCALGADGVTLAVTIPASSFVGGDALNIVPGQTALTLADGTTAYVPSKAGVLVTPNIVSAALTNATVISVALPAASVLTSTAAADCSAAVVIASNGSAVASPLSACAVSADGLTLTLTAAATYKPMAGDTVDVAVSQTVLRAGSATGPAYVPRPAPALITVPSPPPSPPPSPAPSPPPSPPVSTANYSARGLATGPLSCNVQIGANTITTTSGNFTGLPSYAGKDASFRGSCKDAVTGAVYTDDTVASTLPAGLTGLVLAPVTALASVWDISSVADLADTNKDYLRLLGVPVNASAYGSATALLAYDYYVKGFVALETPAVAVMNVEGMVAANLLMYTKFFDGLNSSVAGRDITAGEALAAGQYALAMGLEMATTPVNTSDPAAILQLINSTYSILTAKNATAGRRLLQTAVSFTQLQAQATALAAAAAGSNALVAVQQAKLIAAINAGTSISAADLTNIINEASKVIVTQSTVIANAATGLASGAISPAAFTSSYTGSALTTLVAQQQLAATPGSDVTASPPPAPPSEDSKSNTALIVGLVVGLVGGAIVITLIVVFIVMRRRKQNVAAAGQATA